MADYLTEQEQIQQLKTWLKQYGPTVILGIIIALLMTTGWRYWQNYQNKILTHASGVYDEMLASRAENNTNSAIIQAKKLLRHYAKTPYADVAALLLARDAVLKKNNSEALKQLSWVMDHSKNASLREIARIRQARVLIAEAHPDQALELLSKIDDKAFNGLVNEIKGDAYLAQQNIPAAREAYGQALHELPHADISQPILQMKYANLTQAPQEATAFTASNNLNLKNQKSGIKNNAK